MSLKYNKAKIPQELSVPIGEGSKGSDFETQKISVPCQKGCPVSTNIPLYIQSIYNKEFDRAYEVNLEDNVLPGVLGRICARPCQDECRHNWTDINGPVEICRLKRVAADFRKQKGAIPAPWFSPSMFKVAIVGGGPAGLAGARELKRYGHDVTLFEKEKQLGGMLVDGIPRFRLPLEIIKEEVSQIIDTDIKVHLNSYVDQDKLKSIINEYDAVLVATGTVLPNVIDIKGLTSDLYSTGIDFMKMYNHKKIKHLEGDVVIIGGGFTAIDTARSCARTARKLLGDNGNVTIVYRRTHQFMAADQHELDELRKENINILTLHSPVAVDVIDGKMQNITCKKNYLAESSTDGKPEIIPVEESEFKIKCNHLVLAIGQKQDMTIFPPGIAKEQKFTTTHKKVFLAGDITNGSLDVIHSIADGKDVASVIDTFLCGKKRLKKVLRIEEGHHNGETGRFRTHDVQLSKKASSLPIDKRVPGDPEVEAVYSDKEQIQHASRCYFCHYKFEIDQDKCIHCNWCIDVAPRKCIHKVSHFDIDKAGIIKKAYFAADDESATFIWIENKNCIRCGKCFRVCPVEAISMRKTTEIVKKVE